MRIAVHGDTLAGRERMRGAALALARRGHAVTWWGGGAPSEPGISPVTRTRALQDAEVEVVVGAGGPVRVTLLGWRARARALVLDASASDLARWTALERWLAGTLHALVLIEERDADAARGGGHELAVERFGLWPAAPPAPLPDVTDVSAEVLERACERALARSRGRARRAALFVDRDGTLVVERGYLSDPDEIELLPGVAAALREVAHAGHPIVLISNQSGVGRGLFPLARAYEAMASLRRHLRAVGVELDGIYFCPHRPDEGCACRKPGTALLERAADDLLLDLRGSWMVGDKRLDVATGQAAGGMGVLVRTGYGRDEEARVGDGAFARRPDRVVDDLPAAARAFLAAHEGRMPA